MKNRNQLLLAIVRNIYDENVKLGNDLCLTGSLALELMGYDLGRELKDIDFIVEPESILLDNNKPYNKSIWFPSTFKLDYSGKSSAPHGISFTNYSKSIKVDIFQSYEFNASVIDGIRVSSKATIFDAKLEIMNDKPEDSPVFRKHLSDFIRCGESIKYLF